VPIAARSDAHHAHRALFSTRLIVFLLFNPAPNVLLEQLTAMSRPAQLLRQFDSVESNDVGRDGIRVVKGLCKSENFRSLDDEVPASRTNFSAAQLAAASPHLHLIASQARAVSGRLEVIDLSAHGGGALAPQELLQQQLQQVSLAACCSEKADAESIAPLHCPSAAAPPTHASAPSQTCNTCAGSFADPAEHRAHFKCPCPIFALLTRFASPYASLRLSRSSAADLIGIAST
jgi:hypothetical protein